MNRRPYVIIGNSAAAIGCVAGIREADRESPITIIASEPHHTYSRPLVSYLLGGKVDDENMLYRPMGFYAENNVTPILGVEVKSLDTDARTLETSTGETITFDKLLVATGGTPIVPRDVEGLDAEGVFTFTTWDDAKRIREFIGANSVTEAVIVGGGLIGLKSVEALVALGIRTTVVELADRILSATFDRVASDLATKKLLDAGVKVLCETTVSRIEQEQGKVCRVVLRDETELACRLLIFAIGVIPNTSLVAGTPIDVDRGILVDASMQTNIAGIYAAGDVAQASDLLTGKRRCIAILPNAYRQGLVAGCNMAGGTRTYEGGLAMNAVDICGLPTISVGITEPEGDDCEVLTRLDTEAPGYKKIVLRDNRIIGFVFIGGIDRAGIITGLIKSRIDVSSFKDLLLTDEFGLISLPSEYRKHIVSGMGIEV